MVNFNEKDYFLPTLKSDSKLGRLTTKRPYRIYGLKQTDNPLIQIGYSEGNRAVTGKIDFLNGFFKNNGVEMEFTDEDRDKVSIGLRKDLRAETVLCSCILQTIVYYLEGRLKLSADYKLPGKAILEKLCEPKKKEKKVEKAGELAAKELVKVISELPGYTFPQSSDSLSSGNDNDL